MKSLIIMVTLIGVTMCLSIQAQTKSIDVFNGSTITLQTKIGNVNLFINEKKSEFIVWHLEYPSDIIVNSYENQFKGSDGPDQRSSDTSITTLRNTKKPLAVTYYGKGAMHLNPTDITLYTNKGVLKLQVGSNFKGTVLTIKIND